MVVGTTCDVLYTSRSSVHVYTSHTNVFPFHMNNSPDCMCKLFICTRLCWFALPTRWMDRYSRVPATPLPALCVLYRFVGHSLYRDCMIQCLPPCIICLLSSRRWTVVSISFSFWRMCLLCVYCIIRRISSVLLRFWVPTGSCMSNAPLLICDWALALHGTSTGSSMYVPPYAKPMGLRYQCIPPAGRIMSIR